ncbi:MAG TPA: GatB/YqeY domain-containing protein [Candidatus Dormibacteraeota bacterium]
MALFEQIDVDLVAARKQRDETRLSTLGLLKSEIVKATKVRGSGGAADDLVLRVVRQEVKRREEAARVYDSAGRAEAARKEEAEAAVLRGYLPADLDDAELEREVQAAIDEVQPQGPRDFGAVMKAANARLAGRAEGGRIATVARRLLGS